MVAGPNTKLGHCLWLEKKNKMIGKIETKIYKNKLSIFCIGVYVFWFFFFWGGGVGMLILNKIS